jgi:hypothetical protein
MLGHGQCPGERTEKQASDQHARLMVMETPLAEQMGQ